MKELQTIITNKYLYVPLIVWFCIQVFKVITDLIKTKKFNFKRIMGAGGMPSSHSAVVTSLATLVGIERGFNSTDFAIVAVFALIIMYDATGVRRAVGKQAAILNQILDDIHHKKHIEQKRLKELIGHTPKEVLFGAILGILTAIVFV